MVSAKCVKIDSKRGKYLLKDGNGDERWVTRTQLKSVIGKQINIINLDKKTLHFKSGFGNYYELSSDNPSEKSKQVDIKSTLMGVRPDTLIGHNKITGEVVEACTSGNYDSLYITDYTRNISGDIKANTITFIGEQVLSHGGTLCRISCRKALVYNKCIIDSFSDEIFRGKVTVDALEIEMKHDYIDENTIFEMYYLLNASKVKNPRASLMGRLHLVLVHFEDLDLSEKLLLKNIKFACKCMHSIKKGMFLDIEQQFKDYKVNIEGFSAFDDTEAGKQTYHYLNGWCTYMAFLISLYKSLPQFRDCIIDEWGKAREVMYKIVRSYRWDYVHTTEWLSKCHSLCAETMNYYNSCIGDSNGN